MGTPCGVELSMDSKGQARREKKGHRSLNNEPQKHGNINQQVDKCRPCPLLHGGWGAWNMTQLDRLGVTAMVARSVFSRTYQCTTSLVQQCTMPVVRIGQEGS